jgi:hypothetical protein
MHYGSDDWWHQLSGEHLQHQAALENRSDLLEQHLGGE